MSLNAAEQKIRKLARLPANCACPNCGTYKKFGFSTICIKYHTFVCNYCKSSHQAISHRCKSLTMSSWSDAEADELMRKGNEYARRTWLKNAPPVGSGGRPREGDDINLFKRFIETTYERKSYYGEDEGAGAASPAPARQPRQMQQQVRSAPAPAAAFGAQQRTMRAPPSAPAARAPAPATWSAPVPAPAPPVPVADLLDFSAPAPASAPPIAAADDPFSGFAARAAPASAANPSSGFAFMGGGMPAATAPMPAPAPMPVAAPAPVPIPTPVPMANSDPFADFSGMAATGPAPAPTLAASAAMHSNADTMAAKKSVMRNMGMNTHSSAISMMNNLGAANKQNAQQINIDPFGMQNNNGAAMQNPMQMQQAQQQQMMQSMMQNMMQNPMMMQQQQQQQQQRNMMMMMQQGSGGGGGTGQPMNFPMNGSGMGSFMQPPPQPQQQKNQSHDFGMGNAASMMAMMNGFQTQQQPMGGSAAGSNGFGSLAMNPMNGNKRN